MDKYASKALDMPVQFLLKKKFAGKRKKKMNSAPKTDKVSLPSYLQLRCHRMKNRNISSEETPSNRSQYSRKAKVKELPKKSRRPRGSAIQDISAAFIEDKDLVKTSRTRSGVKSTDVIPKEESTPVTEKPKVELAGEWENTHTFVCCSCGSVYLDLAAVMDHKWEAHPGVWCAHTMLRGQARVPDAFCQQYQPAGTAASSLLELQTAKAKLSCSQCAQVFERRDFFHAHLIDCGGLNVAPIPSKKKNKKGTRFRRRKGQGIPSRCFSTIFSSSTPVKQVSSSSTPTTNEVKSEVRRKLVMPTLGAGGKQKINNKIKSIISKNKAAQRGGKLSSSPKKPTRKATLQKKIRPRGSRATSKTKAPTEASKQPRRRNSSDEEKKSADLQKAKEEKEIPKASTNKGRDAKRTGTKATQQTTSNSVESESKGGVVKGIRRKIKKLIPKMGKKKKDTKDVSITSVDVLPKSSNEIIENAKSSKATVNVAKLDLDSYEEPKTEKAQLSRTESRRRSVTKELKNESENMVEFESTESEVIHDFRRSQGSFGRSGLRERKKKDWRQRYSLRRSHKREKQKILVQGEYLEVQKGNLDEDDDTDSVVAVGRLRAGKRKYNIEDDSEDERRTKPRSFVVDANVSDALSDVAKSKGVKVLNFDKEKTTSSENTNVCTLSSPSKPNRRKSSPKPSIKNKNSKFNKFYFIAQKKISKLKWRCRTNDSESSGFEGFSPLKRRKNNSNAPRQPSPEQPQEDNQPSTGLGVQQKENKSLDLNESKKRKPKRRNLTPAFVTTDSEMSGDEDEINNKAKRRTSDAIIQRNEMELKSQIVDNIAEEVVSERWNNLPLSAEEKTKKRKRPSVKKQSKKRPKLTEKAANDSEINVGNCQLSVNLDEACNIKKKIKSKKKCSFKKKLLVDSLDVPADKPKSKKILKEVRVLSYKSLNTKDTNAIPSVESSESVGECKLKEQQQQLVRGKATEPDENFPAVVPVKKPRKRRSNPKSAAKVASDPMPTGLMCSDCGLRFESALCLEEHRPECRDMALDISMMTEDALFDCMYCHLTFAMRGTRRRHMDSCRGRRSKKANSAAAARRRGRGKNAAAVAPPRPTNVPSSLLSVAPQQPPELPPAVEMIGPRLLRQCESRPAAAAVCWLMTQFRFGTNDLRALLTTATCATESASPTDIDPTTLHLKSSGGEAAVGATLTTLLQVVSHYTQLSTCIDTTGNDLCIKINDSVKVSLSRAELLQAVASLEELLREVAQADEAERQKQMLMTMKQTFEADTNN